jgi:dienelactone hydrolase
MRSVARLALLVLVALLAFLVVAAMSPARAQSPPFTMVTKSMRLAGESVSVDVYLPSEAAPRGAAILAHGFARSRIRHRDLGEALAAAGFIAVVPDLPDLLDAWHNADAIVTLADKLESGDAGAPAVQRDRLVLVGTSIGGLVTIMAAAKLPGVAGWVGLDPVDRTRSAVRAASKLAAPAVVLLAKPSFCNLFGSGGAIARAAPGLLRSTVVEGASHCDFEGPTDGICRAACGHGSNEMRTLVRVETVRAVAEMLHAPELRQTSLVSAEADWSGRRAGTDSRPEERSCRLAAAFRPEIPRRNTILRPD